MDHNAKENEKQQDKIGNNDNPRMEAARQFAGIFDIPSEDEDHEDTSENWSNQQLPPCHALRDKAQPFANRAEAIHLQLRVATQA